MAASAAQRIEEATSSSSGRKLRIKERRLYTEEFPDEEEIENTRMFSVEEKLTSDRFASINFVKEMKGHEITVKFFQENGFSTPILVKGITGLGMKIPDRNFTVDDVRQHVGNRRMLDVVDVNTQTDSVMTMKDWCKYWEETPRDKMLNVISLEFSHTKLENMIESPAVVRSIDWVDWVWPKHLTESHTEATNVIEDMKYPKVRKYVLMSVKGCYTDFHIDFGGTSVWYHILYGKKVFWLIPPSEKNIQLFEQWVLSGKQSDIFFGDLVDQCSRVYLEAGDTFFIPSGYIHSVFTPEDSLVFGGNFLHSYAIEKQLRVAQVEDTTKVKSKFRYPFYIELHWYLLERYVHCLTGKTHLSCREDGSKIPEAEGNTSNGSLSPFKPKVPSVTPTTLSSSRGPQVHLTSFEVTGLKAVIMWLSRLPPHKRHVPELIVNPDALLNDAKILVDDHASDDSSLACSGRLPLTWKTRPKNAPPLLSSSGLSLTAQLRQMKPGLFSSLHHKHHHHQVKSGVTSEVKRPEAVLSRPQTNSLSNFTVKPSTILNEMPSAFNDLIASTGASSCQASSLSSASSSSTAVSLAGPVSSSSSTPTRVVLNASSSGITSSVSSSLLPSTPVTTTFSTQALPLTGTAKGSFISQQRVLDANQSSSSPVSVIADEVVDQIPQKPIVAPVVSLQSAPQSTPGTSNGKAKDTPPKNSNDSSRRRRTRCKKCESCVRADCGECHFCKDMKKFGGPGRMKQSCITRQCLTPVLPHTACCMICGRDGWEKLAASSLAAGLEDNQSSLMECSQCWEILHPVCLKEKHPSLDLDLGRRDDLPNSWECPKCVVAMKSVAGPKIRPAVVVSQKVTPGGGIIIASGVKQENLHHPSFSSSATASLFPASSSSVSTASLSSSESSVSSDVLHASISGENGMKVEEKVAENDSTSKEEPVVKKLKVDHDEVEVCLPDQDLPPSSSREEGEGSSHDSSVPKIPSSVNSLSQDSIPCHPQTASISPKKPDDDTEKVVVKQKKKYKKKEKVQNPNESSQDIASDLQTKKTEKKASTKKKKEETLKDKLFRSLEKLKTKPTKSNALSGNKEKKKKDKKDDTEKKEKKKKEKKIDGEKKKTDVEKKNKPEKEKKKKEKKSDSEKKKKNPLTNKNDCGNNSKSNGTSVVKITTDHDELGQFIQNESETDNETMDTNEVTVRNVTVNSSPKTNNFMGQNSNGIGLDGRPLVFPRFVVRPAPLKEDCTEDEMDNDDDDDDEDDDENSDSSDEEAEVRRERRKIIRKHLRRLRRPRKHNLALERDVIFPILRYMRRKDLLSCSEVCKAWNAWATDPSFCDSLDASGQTITPAVLTSIVKRQPNHLDLSWTNVSWKQLTWLLPRIPQTGTLKLAGCSASAVTAICTSNCPLIKSLDLSWIDAFDDDLFRELVSSPPDQRPGLSETKTRLRNIQELSIAGSEITDASIRMICSTFPQLTKLDMSNCSRITDMGIAILSACSRAGNLTSLSLHSCDRLTDHILESLSMCPKLTDLDLRNCPSVTCAAFVRFFQLQSQRNRVTQTHNKCMKETKK